MLGVISAGAWWVFLERPAETAVEDALKNGKAAQDRQDYAEAMRSYRKAADQGQADAQVYIGDLFYLGRGVSQEPPRPCAGTVRPPTGEMPALSSALACSMNTG